MKTLVVFVDALGPAQVELFRDALDFAPYRTRLDGTMGYTCGALPTLLTGVSPVEHGRMCLFGKSMNPSKAPLAQLTWLGLLPRALHQRGALRRRVGQLFARAHKWDGYFELYRVPPQAFEWLDAPEKEDLFWAEDISGYPTFLATARQAGLSVYASPWQLEENERWQHAFDHLRCKAPDLSFLYTPVLDGVLHRDGTDSAGAEQAAQKIAGRIDRAMRLLKRSSAQEVELFIVGDHGMADVRQVVDPRGLGLDKLSVRKFVDSTMMRFWGSTADIERARQQLMSSQLGGSWISSSAREARQLPAKDDSQGQAFYLLPEGSLFAPSYLGGAVRGMHGYDLSTSSSQSALLSSVPVPDDIAKTADLAHLVLQSLGLEQRTYGRQSA